jgi:FO synthase
MDGRLRSLLDDVACGRRLESADAVGLAASGDLPRLMKAASALRDAGHHVSITYSRKVFIPLTQLCRDVCHYCTFAQRPNVERQAYLNPEQVLAIARAGAAAGCREALFTLGDKPELRYQSAREGLSRLGYDSTLAYLAGMCRSVFEKTGLLPHVNPGTMSADDIALLRGVSVSQGIMLESASQRLCRKGGPHFGSPDKAPAERIETIRLAGEARVPFTSGILIGIGETRTERIESLLALRDLHDRYGHIQEIIVQNFRAKLGTRMGNAPEPTLEDHLWTIAIARLVFGPAMNIQAPPNLRPGALPQLMDAGINDWGGVSPVTPDHVNPEAPWPHLDSLARETGAAGKILVERLAIYPDYARNPNRWVDPALHKAVLDRIDADGLARIDEWSSGTSAEIPAGDGGHVAAQRLSVLDRAFGSIIDKARAGETLTETEVTRLFWARGGEFAAVCVAANELRAAVNGERVSYVVNRNINYTNVCYFRCRFCAFSKGKLSENLRGQPYDLSLAEIERRVREAWRRGATEVCMQGGIHPEYTGSTYIDICRVVKSAAPDIHVHAFSPLEVWQGARTIGVGIGEFLTMLRAAGLGTLPGTAAEILDDEVRAIICPDKINTAQWFEVIEAAHSFGLRSTATIMYGHVEEPLHWVRHLLRIRALQARTGQFTEFVPLPFVHMEAPLYLKHGARRGPTFREAVLMHAVARLVLHPHITNIQTSWVKMGPAGVAACLNAGANDLGGTLMNETITRAAGATFGQEMPPEAMDTLISSIGRVPVQRTTLYGSVPPKQRAASYGADPLSQTVNTPTARYARDRRLSRIQDKGLLGRHEGGVAAAQRETL